MTDERLQLKPSDERERRDRYAVYAGRLAAATWILIASMIATVLMIKRFHEDIDMWTGPGLIVFYVAIPSVTVVPLPGLAALIFGIRGRSRDRVIAADDYDRAPFGIATGILTTVWFAIAWSIYLFGFPLP